MFIRLRTQNITFELIFAQNHLMKKLWAILAGIAIAVIIVIISDIISHKIYPLPEGLDFTDTEQIAAYMRVVPAGALISVIIGQVLALFLGGLVVIKIAAESKPLHIFSLIFILMSVMNLVMIPHPIWFAITSLLALVFVYFVLSKIIKGT